jgi:hypothetical protein
MTTRSIRIPDEIDGAVVAAADAERVSVNTYVVQALQRSVADGEHRTRVAAAYDKVKARNPWISDGRLDSIEAERLGDDTRKAS